MAWLAPKTNWTPADGVADVDYNRMEGNDLDLKNTKLDSSAYTATDVLTKVKTVDGVGSGLDTDLVQGLGLQAAGTAPAANQILRTDGNAYTWTAWLNSVSGDMGASASDRYFCGTSDGFVRFKTAANLLAALQLTPIRPKADNSGLEALLGGVWKTVGGAPRAAKYRGTVGTTNTAFMTAINVTGTGTLLFLSIGLHGYMRLTIDGTIVANNVATVSGADRLQPDSLNAVSGGSGGARIVFPSLFSFKSSMLLEIRADGVVSSGIPQGPTAYWLYELE